MALEIGTAVLGVALAMRVIADTSSGIGGLRWITPLGWAEEMRAFAGPRPGVLLLPLFAAALLLAFAGLIASRRDVGNGLLASRDSSAPRLGLLSSPTALALRSERGSLLGWLAGIGFFAVVFGLLSNTFSSAHLSASLKQQLHRVGGASLITPSGALGFYFLMFVLAIGLFACSQIAALRREEADQRLETLFSLPVSAPGGWRGGWCWRCSDPWRWPLLRVFSPGRAPPPRGWTVSLLDMIGAGANCLPAALLFLALGALAFALVPRASAGIAYGLVSATFLWELFGALLGAPAWTLDLSPFHHVGLVPAQPFKAPAAALMLGIAAVAMILALRLFRRRDLAGG